MIGPDLRKASKVCNLRQILRFSSDLNGADRSRYGTPGLVEELCHVVGYLCEQQRWDSNTVYGSKSFSAIGGCRWLLCYHVYIPRSCAGFSFLPAMQSLSVTGCNKVDTAPSIGLPLSCSTALGTALSSNTGICSCFHDVQHFHMRCTRGLKCQPPAQTLCISQLFNHQELKWSFTITHLLGVGTNPFPSGEATGLVLSSNLDACGAVLWAEKERGTRLSHTMR